MSFLHEFDAIETGSTADCFDAMKGELEERHLFSSMAIQYYAPSDAFRISCSGYYGVGLWSSYLRIEFTRKDMKQFQGTTFEFFDELIGREIIRSANDGPPF